MEYALRILVFCGMCVLFLLIWPQRIFGKPLRKLAV